MWHEKETSIKEIDTLLKQGYEVEVDSPDGYVPVNFFVDKGEWQEYVLELDDPSYPSIRCNENHLFETAMGWEYAKNLVGKGEINFLTDNGYIRGEVYRTNEMIPIVDINVDHKNHRYYTNGVSSHNTGVGKSLFMCHMAGASLSEGKNVLYITMEMAEERIAERIDANLLNIPIDQLENLSKDMFRDRVSDLAKKTQGKLIIKEYPTGQANTSHFRALLNELKLKKNFVPDIIFIDYLNICASARMKGMGGAINSYSYIKSIAEEIRGLAVEFNVPIVSATQTTRSGYSNDDVGLEDTSESFGLPATADFMFALISNSELANQNKMLVKQLKNRYNDPTTFERFVVGVDRSKMRLYDCEQTSEVEEDTGPAFDNSSSGDRLNSEKFENFKL